MKLVQEIKAHSSKWMKTKGEKYEHFFWQDGYGAFSVSEKQKTRTVNYIVNQRRHHEKENFKTEMIDLLEIHNIEYDEKYLWG